MSAPTATRVRAARVEAAMIQRRLVELTSIPRARLRQIESGERSPRMDEVVLMATALGCRVSRLTGHNDIRDRAQFFGPAKAKTSAGSEELFFYLELDAGLDDQGIPAVL